MQIRLRISTVGKSGHQRARCRKRAGGQGSFAVWGPRFFCSWPSHHQHQGLWEHCEHRQRGLEQCGCWTIFLYFAVSQQLIVPHYQYDSKKIMPNSMAGQKLHKQGELSTAAGVQLLSCPLARCWACTSVALKSVASYSGDLGAHPSSSISSAVL